MDKPKPPELPGTEAVSPRYRDLDAWDTATAVEALWEGQMAAVAAIRPALPAIAAAAEAAATRLATGGRLAYAGAGTSGRLAALDGAELHPTFAWPTDRMVVLFAGGPAALTRAAETAEDDPAAARAAVAAVGIGAADVVIGLAASGSTPYTVAAITEARSRGALAIGIANSPGAKLLAAADHAILIDTGAEAIAGSTRMKAGTAQKAVLTLLSTAIMLRLGRVYRGQMVAMPARNAKLHARARRILADIAGCTPDEADAALKAAGDNLPLATIMLHGLERREAEALLARHGGALRPALAALTEPSA